jgi:hypothetical protein
LPLLPRVLCGFCFLLSVFILAACQADIPEEEGLTVKLRIYGDDGTRYYSLSSGDEITDPAAIASAAWDIALEAHDGCFFVLTNSGDSAVRAGSGGQGAVWHTERFDLDRTGLEDRVAENLGDLAPYTVDRKRYTFVMSTVTDQYLNVMTYLGYPGSDDPAHNGETEETFFNRKEPDSTGMASYVPFLFNQKQFYTMRGMPPNYTPTYRVYILRHGDGAGFSKLQVNDVYLEYDSKTMANSVFVLKLRYENL